MHNFRKYSLWFCMPAVLMTLVFAVYPVIHSFVLGFFSMDLHSGASGFAGLNNYIRIFSDERALKALLNTFFFTVSSVSLELVFGMALALILHAKFRGRGLLRSSALIPWAVPTVVSAMLWRWIFNDRFGLINAVLIQLGLLNSPEAFLASPWLAKAAIVAAEVWKTTPFIALLLLAGMQMIPEELYESGKVDGAGPFQRFRLITLPMLKPVILISLLFRTMDALRIFDTVYVLTGGGPGNATETISLYTYKKMFSHLDFGMGSALASSTFAVVAMVSAVYIMLLRRKSVE
ncbi:MAG: sugar ABC transporter permease [Elusimicrobiota bacterium]